MPEEAAVEEIKTETTVNEEKTEATEEKIEDAKEELKDEELTPKQRDKVQARIDELVAKLSEQARIIEELQNKTSKPPTQNPLWTEEKLIEVLNDENRNNSERAWAQRELNKLDTKKMLQEVVEQQQVAVAMQSSIDKAAEEYPDLLDKTSELWQTANKIYIANNLDRVKDGQYIAAKLAVAQLDLPKITKVAVLQKKVDKQNAKTALASGGQKVVVSNTAVFEKIKKAALEKGPDSKEWMDWQKLVVKNGQKT